MKCTMVQYNKLTTVNSHEKTVMGYFTVRSTLVLYFVVL